jgi:N-acetylglutamate synthase-like GNAT family acetyltransferase
MPGGPTIREGSPHDIPAVLELLQRQGAGDPRIELTHEPGRRHLLVLDADDGGLAAAALVKIDGPRGHLAMLAIAERFEGTGLETRMIAVAEALCRVLGATTMDVPARRAA